MLLLTPHPLPRRRGSVLILVVAVLVLLALMGTAYIATSRSDRIASASSESTASVDTLARGVVDTLKTQIANDRLESPTSGIGTVLRNTATAYFSYNSPTSTLRTDGLLSLAARVPVAPGTSGVDARPRWPFISSPLSASPSDPSFFTNPAPNAPITASSWTPAPARTLNSDRWGRSESERRGSNTNVIGSVTLTADGRTYPAFLTSTGSGPTIGYAIAADADGDGMPDSGLVSLGTLPNPDFAGITFFYGLRVLDNNSAFNANTAWTTGSDTLAGATPTIVRNNRLFPSAIGLKESTTPTTLGGTTRINDFDGNALGQDLTSYRAGRFGTPDPLSNRAIPVVDVDASTLRSDFLTRRTDFQFNTQHELFYFQLARRLDFPGGHANRTGTTDFARFTPFTLAEQAQLAYGFVLAPRDIADNANFAVAIDKRTPIEQLLSGSLYRVSGFPSNPFSLTIPTAPYATSNIGTRLTSPNRADWFNENFNYEVAGGTDPLTILNLRPLLVTHNPVAQSTTFKPLPLEAVFPDDPTVAGATRFDVMHPYVPRWRDPNDAPVVPTAQILRYNPGDVVFGANGSNDGKFYINAFSEPIDGDIDPTVLANQAPASGPTASRPWQIYNGPLVPTKVDLNTAPFGDLWRAFYLAFASDNIDPNDRLNTVSPFGAAPTNQNLPQIYQGMDFTAVGPGGADTFPVPTLSHPQRMFRSNIKEYVGETYLPPDQMVLLRAAQAAVNTEYLRSLGGANPVTGTLIRDVVPRRTISLNATIAGTATPVAATVFAAPRGVYITEVYVHTDIQQTGFDSTTNAAGYIAVELFNPYPFSISLAGWKLQVVDRTAANSGAGRIVQDLFTFSTASGVIVPPGGFIVLENINPDGQSNGLNGTGYTPTDAEYRPAGSGATATDYNTVIAGRYYVPALEKVFADTLTAPLRRTRGELVLARPVNGSIDTTIGLLTCTPAGTVSEQQTIDAVPVDSIDLTSVVVGSNLSGGTASAYHYARRSDHWNFVYPGRYNANPAFGDLMRQQGLRVHSWTVGGPDDSLLWGPPPNLGSSSIGAGSATYTGNGSGIPGEFPIQIANIGFGGPNAIISATPSTSNPPNPPNRFPFGGFLRNLDVLQVPFISPVRIHAPGTPTTQFDVISLTQDAAFAEDTATDDNAEENIGRLTPIILPAAVGDPSRTRAIATIDESSTDPVDIRYGWAADILDYVTVQPAAGLSSPPATARRNPTSPTPTDEPYTVASYPESSTALFPQSIASKPGSFSIPSSITAPDAGNQGLININTAPLPVLAAVPWIRTTNVNTDRNNNTAIARAIIAHREKHGPFRSLFDLNAVRMINATNTELNESFRTGAGTFLGGLTDNPTTPGNTEVFTAAFIANLTADNGDFSPLGDSAATPFAIRAVPDPAFPGRLLNLNTDPAGPPAVAPADPLFNLRPEGDFESQFLMLNAVSNLLTTRSDTFTAYIVIEGWRNAGTPSATRVLQRRYAYILDRTGVAPGVPPQLLDLANQTSANAQPVVNPIGRSRPLNTSIRNTEIPVPQAP